MFESHIETISTVNRAKGLVSDAVLAHIRDDLIKIGYAVEAGKKRNQTIKRPVLFGENGVPELQYQIDAYHTEWRCGLEVEAGRSVLGNAIFRDLFQAMVMVQVDHFCLAVPIEYKYKSGGRATISYDYATSVGVADTLFAHDRVAMPYSLTIIGY